MRLAEAQVVAQTPEPLPALVRRCAAASKGGALYAANANPSPKTYVSALLSAREANARFWRLKRILLRYAQRTSTAHAKTNASAVRRRTSTQALFLSGSGTLSFALAKRKRPGITAGR